MKQWLAMFLAALMLVTCSGLALAEDAADMREVSFTQFCEDAGVPYQGEWISYDDALYLYLPAERTDEDVSSLRGAGALGGYTIPCGQDMRLQMVALETDGGRDLADVQESYMATGMLTSVMKVNGLPVIAAWTERMCCIEVLTGGSKDYYMLIKLVGDEDAEDFSAAARTMYGILYSISAKPMEVDAAQTGAADGTVTADSEVRIQFRFSENREEDLALLNQTLAVMVLTNADLEDQRVYICTTVNYDDNDNVVGTSYRCGLSEGTLVCSREAGKTPDRYQIDTDVLDTGAVADDVYFEHWNEQHPENLLRSLVIYDFDDQKAYLMVYHNKTAE